MSDETNHDPITDPERWRRNVERLRWWDRAYRHAQAQVDAVNERQRRARQRGGTTRGRALSRESLARESAVEHAAEEYRRDHPHDRRTRSTRRMARDIGGALNMPAETVRSILRRLGIH